MTSPRRFTLLFAALGVVLIYLLGDMVVCHGPLRQALERANQRGGPVVARVYQHPITRNQLDRAIEENLWCAGETNSYLTPTSRQAARAAALDALIDYELLRVKVQAAAPQLAVSEDAVNERLQRFVSRFESPAALASALQSQGLASERDLRERLAAGLQQELYIESQIVPLTQITDAEARQWFARNQQFLAQPERVEVRHVFIPTLDHPAVAAKAILEAARADLTAGKQDFATLAKKLSEDPATQDRGGELGWISRNRLPADFTAPVFALSLHQPTLVQTHLGWHLVEVTGRQPAAARTFEQAEAEIRAALEALKRRQAISQLRVRLRQAAAANIEVLPPE